MSILKSPFGYDSNPQAVYHESNRSPFLEAHELGRAVYDLSADANQLKAAGGGGINGSVLAGENDKLILLRLLGDDGLDDSDLATIRAQDFDWNPVAPNTAAGAGNSAVIFRYMPQIQITAAQLSGGADLTFSPITYRLGESSADGGLLLARSAVHAVNLTLIAYEAR